MSDHLENPGQYLIAKLNAFMRTSSGSEDAINDMASRRVASADRGQDIISEGDEPRTVNLLIDGWACRYKMMEDGRRQILAFFLPGDLADLHVYILNAMDHSISAITPVRYARLAPKEFEEISDAHPKLLRALWWESLVTDSIQREWLVSVGQRDALESVAHLACELYLRLKTVGLVQGQRCDFPLNAARHCGCIGHDPAPCEPYRRRTEQDGFCHLATRRIGSEGPKAVEKTGSFQPQLSPPSLGRLTKKPADNASGF